MKLSNQIIIPPRWQIIESGNEYITIKLLELCIGAFFRGSGCSGGTVDPLYKAVRLHVMNRSIKFCH